jgi:uncharacterized protein (TIGR03435 family)
LIMRKSLLKINAIVALFFAPGTAHAQLPPGQPPPVICGVGAPLNGLVEGRRISMAALAEILSELTGRRVVDRTGFTGVFDASLKWS